MFYGHDGKLHFANVIQEDVDLINNDYRGIQCLLSVGLVIRASRRFKLRVDRIFRKSFSFYFSLICLTGLIVQLDVMLLGTFAQCQHVRSAGLGLDDTAFDLYLPFAVLITSG